MIPANLLRAVFEGRLSANDMCPLIAGMIDGTMTAVGIPTIKAQDWSGFAPNERPVTGILTLRDGSKIRITVEEEK